MCYISQQYLTHLFKYVLFKLTLTKTCINKIILYFGYTQSYSFSICFNHDHTHRF